MKNLESGWANHIELTSSTRLGHKDRLSMLNIQGFLEKIAGISGGYRAGVSSCSKNKKALEGTLLRSPLRAIHLQCTGLRRVLASYRNNDHPGYSFERTPWVLVTGMGPFKWLQAPGSRIPPIRADAVAGDLYQPCACLQRGNHNSILAEGTPYGAGSSWGRFRPLVWNKVTRVSSLFSQSMCIQHLNACMDYRFP